MSKHSAAQSTEKHLPVWVIIPAAGVGQRMQQSLPKQYLPIHGKTVIEHTLACFLSHPDVAGVLVVISPNDSYWRELRIHSNATPVHTSLGGKDRCDSVLAGLNYLRNELQLNENEWVLVHDAARPCLQKADLAALLAIRSKNSMGGLLAAPVRDTMKRGKPALDDSSKTVVKASVEREQLWHALTPQMFRLGRLHYALTVCQQQGLVVTDESSAFEHIGETPELVAASPRNLKITHPEDLDLARLFLDPNS